MDTSQFRVEREAWPDDLLPREPEFPLDGAPVHEHVRAQASERPTDPAVTFYGRTLSWADLDEQVSRFAAALCERGHDGEVCALYLQNCPQFYVAYFGAHRAGATVAPLNPQLRDVALEYLLADNDAAALVTHPDQLSTVAAVEDDVSLSDVFVVQYREYAAVPDSPIPVHEVVTGEDPVPTGRTGFADALASADPDRSFPEPAPDDRALLQYTGGTTGMPKGCVHTHWNVTYKAVVRSQAPNEDAVQLAVMPVFHVAGKVGAVDAPAIAGRHVVVLPRYTPRATMAAVDAYGATSTWLTVPMAAEIAEAAERDGAYDLTSLSANRDVMTVTSFGTSLTADLSRRWAALTGARLSEGGYGLSETHTGDAHTVGLDHVEPGFVGQPTYGVEVEIRDFETNEPLPTGEEGEIVLYTPSTMERYHDRPEATAAVLEDDGALHTGDVGRRTEEGFLYFLGRRKDALKVSGHTVSPREVEYAIEESGLVTDALVVGRDHETRGQVLEAHVVPADGETAVESALLAWADEHLAEFKRPKSVVVRESFPRTDLGKVDRAAYRERLDGTE